MLVVDDNHFQLRVVKASLNRSGVELDAAVHGKEAVDLVAKRFERQLRSTEKDAQTREKSAPVYDVILTAEVREVLSYVAPAINLGLDSSTSLLTCLGLHGFHSRLIFWMLVPPVLMGAILVASLGSLLCQRKASVSTLVETALPPFTRLLFILYPGARRSHMFECAHAGSN